MTRALVVRPSHFPVTLPTILTHSTGEEKKIIAPLLAKLHISSASTESLIRELYDEVSAAIEEKLIGDATGRNALFKIHVSLGKIVNSLVEEAPVTSGRKSSVTPSVADEEKTVMAIERDAEVESEKTELVKVEEEEDSEGTVIADVDAKATRDSLVESLPEDSDVEMTG